MGRATSCGLPLDDAMVSRKHATIMVDERGGVLEDLQSRNGVTLNGVRVEAPIRLRHEDRIKIGGQEIVYLCDSENEDLRQTMSLIEPPGANPTIAIKRPNRTDAAARGASKTRPERPQAISTAPMRDEQTREAPLSALAEKSMAMGRWEDAEKLLARLMSDLLAHARQGQVATPARISEATGFALRLAEGMKKPSWIDWVFEYHNALARVIAGPEQERLHDVIRKTKYASSAAFRGYMSSMRARTGLAPNEKFLLQRLASIESLLGG